MTLSRHVDIYLIPRSVAIKRAIAIKDTAKNTPITPNIAAWRNFLRPSDESDFEIPWTILNIKTKTRIVTRMVLKILT